MVLWCYLLWYLVNVAFRFDPTPAIWLNSLGISAVIGCGLLLSVRSPGGAWPGPWQVFRLFLMPFCVSSFAALIKGHGYWLIVSPDPFEMSVAIGACVLFVTVVLGLRVVWPRPLAA